METSRKSFKAYSVAQPIKKEIDDTLLKVELEKRKFLTLERQQTYLRQNLQKKRKELNELKAKQPETKTHSTRTWQTANVINNVDRNYLQVHDNIQHHKASINVQRKQITKYKEMNERLSSDTKSLFDKNEKLLVDNAELETNNEQVKDQIMGFREMNFRNTVEFQKSHNHMNKSNYKEENERKKFSMKQKSFLGEQMKNSKIIPFDNLSDQLRSSGIKFADNSNEIMTQSVPLAKDRIKTQIIKNKEKLKITENYKKFGDNLEQMFQIMKEYKGRDDIDFIAEEFVTKERQLQKIEEYIAQLESRINTTQKTLIFRREEDEILSQEVNAKIQKQDEKYALLQEHAKKDIATLKKNERQFYEWFTKISNILLPLTEQSLTRSNASDLIGNIELTYHIKRDEVEKKAPGKVLPLPAIEIQQAKQSYNELLSYEKMKEFAAEYVKSKKNS